MLWVSGIAAKPRLVIFAYSRSFYSLDRLLWLLHPPTRIILRVVLLERYDIKSLMSNPVQVRPTATAAPPVSSSPR